MSDTRRILTTAFLVPYAFFVLAGFLGAITGSEAVRASLLSLGAALATTRWLGFMAHAALTDRPTRDKALWIVGLFFLSELGALAYVAVEGWGVGRSALAPARAPRAPEAARQPEPAALPRHDLADIVDLLHDVDERLGAVRGRITDLDIRDDVVRELAGTELDGESTRTLATHAIERQALHEEQQALELARRQLRDARDTMAPGTPPSPAVAPLVASAVHASRALLTPRMDRRT